MCESYINHTFIPIIIIIILSKYQLRGVEFK